MVQPRSCPLVLRGQISLALPSISLSKKSIENNLSDVVSPHVDPTNNRSYLQVLSVSYAIFYNVYEFYLIKSY
jgi:hypothetical protein